MTSKFANHWTDGNDNVIISESKPGEYWWPVVSERRVGKATYNPYQGNTEWVRTANRLLASHAQSNWQVR